MAMAHSVPSHLAHDRGKYAAGCRAVNSFKELKKNLCPDLFSDSNFMPYQMIVWVCYVVNKQLVSIFGAVFW